MDLSPFNGINPCGYKQLEVTQIKNFYESITIKQVKQDAVIMMGDLLKNST
jgi:lipoate-protein ligase B